jgi:hypothetical protein
MLKFGMNERVWSRKPVFFHGWVVVAFIDNGFNMYVIKTLGGNLMHVKEEDLQYPPKTVETAKSSGLA